MSLHNRPALPLNQQTFNALLVYFLLMLYAVPSNSDFENQSPYLYYFYTLPIVAWLIVTMGSWLPQVVKPIKGTTYALFFLLIVAIISILRSDITSVLNSALFVLTILSIYLTRVTISLRLLNTLYLMAVLGAIISFHTGISQWGYLPGQAVIQVSETESVAWRVSLFPFVPESAFLSLLVLIINYQNNKGLFKWVICAASLYFMLFAGMRSTFIALGFFALFKWFSRDTKFRRGFKFSIYNWAALFLFILILNLNSLLLGLAAVVNQPFLNQLLFRTEAGVDDAEALQKTIYRTWIWVKHIEIFQSSPLVGIGTFDFKEVVKEQLDQLGTSGSESLLTGMFARYGVVTFLFVFFMSSLNKIALKNAARFSYFIIFFFLLTMLTYGSFLVPYNLMFLLIWSIYNSDGVIVRSNFGRLKSTNSLVTA